MSTDVHNPPSWMFDHDGVLMKPDLGLSQEMFLTDAQWDQWWDAYDAAVGARSHGKGGVKIIGSAGDPEQRRWVEVIDALIDIERLSEGDREALLRAEWVKYPGCPGCGSSGAFLRRDKASSGSMDFERGQVRVTCGRRCRTRDVLAELGIETLPDASEMVSEWDRPDAPPRARDDRSEAQEAPTTSRQVVLTSAAQIKPRPVFWLWKNRLALGSLGLLAGREGLGKSTLGYWIAARLTRGDLYGHYQGAPRSVLVCATEDSWEHTIVPRLMAAGADLDKVFRVEVTNLFDIHVGLSLPRDLIALENAAEQVGASLLLLDPLMSRLGDLDTHRDAEVRQALEPLVAIADRKNMAVLGLIHHNKSGGADPLQLVMGSKAFTAVARSVHTVVPDPDDESETRRLFGTPKNNLGRTDLPTFSFTIVSHPIQTDEGTAWTGRLEWGDELVASIGDAIRRASDSEDDRSAAGEAADWLEDYLTSQGGQAASADIKREGAKAGHSQDALKRARKKVGAGIESSGFPRRSYWSLPTVGAQSEQIPRGDHLTAPTAPTGPGESQSVQSVQSVHLSKGDPPTDPGDRSGTGGGQVSTNKLDALWKACITCGQIPGDKTGLGVGGQCLGCESGDAR